MSIHLSTKHLTGFVKDHELEALQTQVETAHRQLHEKKGLGNDFLGWVELPTDYDKEEFERIKKQQQKFRKTVMF